jgi:hypothetical protein
MLYLTQIHEIGELDGAKLQPAITMMRNEDPKYDALYQYVQGLLERWANFNGRPIFFAEKPFHEIADFSKTSMRRGGLPHHTCKGLKVAVKFSLPALCKRCGARFAHPADKRGEMDIGECQKDFFVVNFICPRCRGIAATYAADLALDKSGDIVSVYPWTGIPEDHFRSDWRNFIDRR